QVIEEALFLSADRVTINPLRPIASSNSIKVRINGVSDVSPAGLQVPAVAKGSLPGPYNIRPGINDKLVVSLNAGAPQTVTLPSGRIVSAQQLALALTQLTKGLAFSVTKKSQIKARTFNQGSAARIMFHAGSTIAPTLGLT